MKALVPILAAALLGLAAAADTPVALRNAAFDVPAADGSAPGWILPPRQWSVVPGAGSNGSRGLVFEGTCERTTDAPKQWIQLRPGYRYRISARVKPENLLYPNMRADAGAALYMEWFDASGKLSGCVMTRRERGTKDWQRREFMTPVVGPGVSKCFVMPLVTAGGTGRAVFDDIAVTEIEDRPVDGVWSSAYRDEAVAGAVRFGATLRLPPGTDTNGLRAVFSYCGADGARRERPGRLVAGGARLELDAADLALGTNDVVCTLFAGARRLGADTLAFARVAKPTPRRVRVDDRARLIVDGRPFLPIGLMCLDIDRTNMETIASGPFNCVMSYTYPSREQLDLCQELGVKVVYDYRRKLDTVFDDEIGRSWMRARVPWVRQHPAVLAWYGDDESPLTLVPRLRGRYRLLCELDPDHPVWICQDKDGPDLRKYIGTCDIFGLDPYPIYRAPARRVTERIRRLREETFGLKPEWICVQGFAWNGTGRKAVRGPTRAEYASMCWQSVAAGANGLLTFRYHSPDERNEDAARWRAEMWPSICSVAADLRRFERVILAEPGPALRDVPDALAVRTWRTAEADWYLLVNLADEPFAGRLGVPASPGAWKVHLSLPDAARIGGGALEARLPALGVSLIERERQ